MFKILIAFLGGLIEVSKCTKVVDNIESSSEDWKELKLKTAQTFIKYRDFVIDN